MRTILAIVSILTFGFFVSCGEATPETKTPPTKKPVGTSDYEKGLELVANNDCLTCHKVDEKNIGPSYREIAAIYDSTPENIEQLAGKIRKGGSGVWGTVPMTPHPQISEEEARTILRYIFTLKEKTGP